ncbi:MAG: AAA family ATPase [Candidatus Methanospirareceae archaeon]
MLTKIAIENFKSIGRRIELELKPLTILVGPNASGKSSILEALPLLVQSIGQSWYDYRGDKYPSLVSYPAFEDVVHKHNPENLMGIELHVTLEESERKILQELGRRINTSDLGVSIDEEIISVGYRYSGCLLMNEWNYAEQEIFCNEKRVIGVKVEYTKIDGASRRDIFTFPPILKETMPQNSANYILHPSAFRQGSNVVESAKPLNDFATTVIDIIISMLKPDSNKSKVYLLSALRGEIDYEVKTDKWREWVGKRGENLISILTQISTPKWGQKREKVREWALEFDIKDPWGGWSGRNVASSEFVDAELNIPSNLALASYGSSQILTVIAQLFWSEKGDIILIEEPEISIHPEGQAKLPELFADAIKEGKQIIITTHSGYLPLALSRALKRGLEADDIAVYEVTKDKEGTKVERKEINERGYIKGWIKSFYDVEVELTKEWAKSTSKSLSEE